MTNVVLWIASGNKYIQESIRAAKSVRRHNIDLDLILCTPDAGKPITGNNVSIFNSILQLDISDNEYWFINSTEYLVKSYAQLADYNNILLLDSDTYCCDNLDDYFAVLKKFDIAGVHAPGRETAQTYFNPPSSFPEMHIGALAIKRSMSMNMFLDDWLTRYKMHYKIYSDNDQAPLRDALWNCGYISPYIMPPEFCFRFQFGGLLRGKCKMLHGRSNMPYGKIEEAVNQHWRKIRTFPRGFFR